MSTKAGKLRTIMIAAACALLLAGCGANKPVNENGGSAVSPSPTEEVTESPAPTPTPTPTEAPKPPTQEVSVYLSDEQLTELIERKVTIDYGNEEDLVKKAMAALQENQEPNISLWHGITVDSVKLDGSVATIDLQIPDESRLGAPGEMMLIDSLKQTLFQFPFVDGIQLLVQGEQVESLMGHVDLEHPIRKE